MFVTQLVAWSVGLIILLKAQVSDGGQLFVTAPSVFHYGYSERLYVIKQGHGNVQISVKTYPFRQQINPRPTLTFNGSIGVANIKIEEDMIPESHLRDHIGKVYLVVTDGKGAENEVLVDVKPDFYNVFTETDKPVYAPKQRASIRVFVTDRNMIPIRHTPRIDIIDGKGNIVRQVLTDPDPDVRGVYSTSHLFSGNPALGIWTIRTSYGKGFVNHVNSTIKVDKYVRPRIHINIQLNENSRFLLEEDSEITFDVAPRYVYNKDAKGYITAALYIVQDTGEDKPFRMLIERGGKKYYDGFPIEFTIPFKEKVANFTNNANFKDLVDKYYLQIEATLLEDSSEEVTKANSKPIHFVKQPYNIDLSHNKPYFVEGIRYVLQVHVTDHYGNPSKETLVTIKSPFHNNIEVNTDDQGNVRKLFNTKNTPRAKFTVMITKEYRANSKKVIKEFIVTKQDSGPGVGSIGITSSVATVSCTDASFDVVLDFKENMKNKKLTMLLVGRNQILQEPKTEVVKDQSTWVVNFRMTPNLSPGVHVVAFTQDGNSETVADSLWLWIGKNDCQQKKTQIEFITDVPRATNYYAPKGIMKLQITTKENDQKAAFPVALFGVDKAILSLHNNVLTNKKIRQASLHTETEIDTSDPCGKCILLNSGLSVIATGAQRWQTGVSQCAQSSRGKREIPNGIVYGDIHSLNITSCCEQARAMVKADAKQTCFTHLVEFRNNRVYSTKCLIAFSKCCMDQFKKRPKSSVVGHSDYDDYYDMMDDNALLDDLDNVIRDDFTESLIWKIVKIGESGTIVKEIQLRDTITTWSIHGVGLSNNTGLSVSPATEVTVFKKEFVEVHVPKKVSRGEQVTLKVTLHNFDVESIVVDFYLMKSDGMCIDLNVKSRSLRWNRKRRRVGKESSDTVIWKFVPMVAGKMEITVASLRTRDGRRTLIDAVTKPLLVKYEGQEMEDTVKSFFLDEMLTHKRVPLTLPRDVVPGSVRAYVRMIGSVLLPTTVGGKIEDLDKWLKMPFGCGYQTRASLASLVHVAKYMRDKGLLTGRKEVTTKSLIMRGIERMLTFKVPDGSFERFHWYPLQGTHGWLTSVAPTVLSHAKEFNLEIDLQKEHICPAINWLTGGRERWWLKRYPYQTKHMCASAVVIAIMETGCESQKITATRESAINYLASRYETIETQSMAMVAYAFSMANAPQKNHALELLKQKSVYDQDADMRHWVVTENGWYNYFSEVIAASYGLLAFLRNNDLPTANGIVRWLIDQRKSSGRFRSMEDTAIAMQALLEYSIQTKEAEIDMTIETSSLEGKINTIARKFHEDNFMIQQTFTVTDAIGADLQFRALNPSTIKGKVAVQVELRYNKRHILECNGLALSIKTNDYEFVYEDQSDDESYVGDQPGPRPHTGQGQEQDEGSLRTVTIPLIISAIDDESEMSIVHVNLLSGFEMTASSLSAIRNTEFVDEIEISAEKGTVDIYLEKITTSNIELLLKMERKEFVSDINPMTIDVYDYDNQDKRCSIFYDAHGDRDYIDGRSTPDGYTCLEGRCPECYAKSQTDYETLSKEDETIRAPFDYDALQREACRTYSHFVYVVEIDKILYNEDTGMNEIYAYPNEILKNGKIDTKTDDELVLHRVGTKCKCPNFEMGKEYLVMGKEEDTSDGDVNFILDDKAYVQEWDENNPELRRLKAEMEKIPCTE